jgi:C-terminal processing protease CtpA/Prc
MKRMKALGVFLLAIGALCANAATEKDVYRVLKERGIAYDTNVVQRAVVDCILKAIDPHSRIIASNEVVAAAGRGTIATNEEWQEGICYLKLNGLCEGGGTQVVSRLREWSAAGKCGVIMDMRGAGGKNLAAVDEIASAFTQTNAVLYSLKNGNGKVVEKHEAIPGLFLVQAMPLILLVNDETLDAGEILAAVMKGTKGVMLLGTKTRGDNAIRELLPLSAAESLYIATRWVLPGNGIEYNGAGVLPNIVVPAGATNAISANAANAMAESDSIRALWKPLSDKAKLDRGLMQRASGDAMVLRATDILLGLKGLRSNATETATNTLSSAGQ